MYFDNLDSAVEYVSGQLVWSDRKVPTPDDLCSVHAAGCFDMMLTRFLRVHLGVDEITRRGQQMDHG